jgi:hypothetical protein
VKSAEFIALGEGCHTELQSTVNRIWWTPRLTPRCCMCCGTISD